MSKNDKKNKKGKHTAVAVLLPLEIIKYKELFTMRF